MPDNTKIDYSKLGEEEPAESPGWFVHVENKDYGPFTRAQMVEFSLVSRIKPETLVKHAQSTKDKWVHAKRIRFLTSLRSAPSTSKPTPPIPNNQPDEKWSVRGEFGTVSGPYNLNDILNFAALGTIRSDSLLLSDQRFNREWVAAFRIPEIASTLRQAKEFSPVAVDLNPFSTNRILAYVSGGSFVLAGGIWLLTIIGFPIAIIAFCMAGFNIVSASVAHDKSYGWCRGRYQLIGILDIVMGFVTLGNLIAIICGIANLASLPPELRSKRS